MTIGLKGFVGKVVSVEDFAADEGFEWECCEHV